MEKRVLILGVGNLLFADEGFGPAAIDYLVKNYVWPANIKLVDGANMGLMLLAELFECDLAVILDIALCGKQPGTFYFMENDDLDKSFSIQSSMHQAGVKDILLNCELAGHRPEVVIFGIEPFDWQTCQPFLTEKAREKLPAFCDMVVSELKNYDIFALKKL